MNTTTVAHAGGPQFLQKLYPAFQEIAPTSLMKRLQMHHQGQSRILHGGFGTEQVASVTPVRGAPKLW